MKTVILSASRYTLTPAQNKKRTLALLDELRKCGFERIIPCKGVFEGTSEDSFTVVCDHASDVEFLSEIANDYEQDCILEIDSETLKSTLVFPDLSREEIGKWCRVGAREAVEGDHTFYPSANSYYMVK